MSKQVMAARKERPITFYPDEDILKWYESLGPRAGTPRINELIRLGLQVEEEGAEVVIGLEERVRNLEEWVNQASVQLLELQRIRNFMVHQPYGDAGGVGEHVIPKSLLGGSPANTPLSGLMSPIGRALLGSLNNPLVGLERKPPRMMAMLKVYVSQESFDNPLFELPLQFFTFEDKELVVVAHRNTNQLDWIRPKLEFINEQDQPEIYCKVDQAHRSDAWTTKYIRSSYERNEFGIYPVLRFEMLKRIFSIAETNDFSAYNAGC